MGEVYRARDSKLNRDVARQGPARRPGRGPRATGPLRTRGTGAGGAQSPEHRPGLRLGHRRVHRLPGHGTGAWRGPGGDDHARPAVGRRRPRHRPADRRCPRSRARRGHRPSRSEAGQHQGPARRHRQGARFRPGESGAGSRRAPAHAFPTTRQRSPPRPRPCAVSLSEPRPTCRRSRRAATPSIGAATSGRSASCSTRCWPDGGPSRATAWPTCSAPSCASTRTGPRFRRRSAGDPRAAPGVPAEGSRPAGGRHLDGAIRHRRCAGARRPADGDAGAIPPLADRARRHGGARARQRRIALDALST